MSDVPPMPTELTRAVVSAKMRLGEPDGALVQALWELLLILSPYVRAGISAPVMVDAYRAGWNAIAAAGRIEDRA